MLKRIPRLLIALILTGALLFGACGKANTTSTAPVPASAEIVSTESAPASNLPPAEEAVSGGNLNRFFPKSDAGYERVFVQEKAGFSQAKLKQNGEELGLLSINDLSKNPKALGKFEKSDQALNGYPLVAVGSTQTAILVGDRYQVKVKSSGESLTPEDRKIWLIKFNLAGLSQLK